MKPRAAAKCGRRRREKLKCHPAVGRRREKEDKREKHTDGGGEIKEKALRIGGEPEVVAPGPQVKQVSTGITG